jgi:CHAT domain-containing protein/cytochrome c-type biogenesis protein CcmH/NrfG
VDSNQHLDASELAKLLEELRLRPESAPDSIEAHSHFDVCADCRDQFKDLVLLERQLKSVSMVDSALRQSACPDPAGWRGIVGEMTPPEEALSWIEHASRCDYCGPLLRSAVVEFAELHEELTEDERRHIATLDSASEAWQRQLAQRIVGSPAKEKKSGAEGESSPPWPRSWRRLMSIPRLAIVGVSCFALAAVGMTAWTALRRNQAGTVDRLLARAYTEKRNMELRIAGADYAPLRVSLGPAASFTSRPATLLRAEALIAAQLDGHPSDPEWLRAKAQADILEGKYDAAVETLRRARELDPQSPALLIDLATAYFQRAQQEARKEDFNFSYEYLSEALQLSPDDHVALFNRAIVAEHQFLYDQAVEDWEHYLRMDSGSEWAEEARSRVSNIKEKLKEHRSQAAPLLGPEQVVALTGDPRLRAEVDVRIDEYLHEAVRFWLPQAFPEPAGIEVKTTGNPSAARALFFLAELTSREHGDQWLTDLLRGSTYGNPAPHFVQAANALARAVQSNASGEYDVSYKQAELAEQLFRSSLNPAGAMRAKFEQLFAAQLLRHGELCRKKSIIVVNESKGYSYPWVQSQLGLENSVCSEMMGDLGTAESAARRSQSRALEAGYGSLALRALGFVAELNFEIGNRSVGLKLVSTGLQQYWSNQFPVMRGYNLYTFAAEDAENTGQPNLQLANWREATAIIDKDDSTLLRAEAHNFLAKAAGSAHQPELAERQYLEAARLYRQAPQNDAIRVDLLEMEIRNAQLKAHQGEFDVALDSLNGVQSEVQRLSDSYLAQVFYSTLGETQLRAHVFVDAEQSFRTAVGFAERELASLSTESARTRWSKEAAPLYLGLAEAELIQGRQQDSLDVFEWYLGAPQRAGIRGHVPIRKDLSNSRPSLPDPAGLPSRLPLLLRQTVLAYAVLPDGLAVWMYDNRGLTAKWISKSPQELEELAANFYALCSDPESDPRRLREAGQHLYALLITPTEERLDPTRTLAIETEGFLARLPFEALVDERGHYLIERVSIVHWPGPYAEAQMHSEAAITANSAALVVGSAAAAPDDGLFAIPNVSAATETVARLFHSSRVIEGHEATLLAVTNALPSAAVFHFAGHALNSFHYGNDAGLLLEGRDARSGAPTLLDANVVRTLKLPSMELAVLAACNTDSGEAGSRGLDSVAEALQTSGVPHVVASRWAVDLLKTNGFMDSFYDGLVSSQPVSTALWITSKKMLQSPATASPYYWAAFAAYGRP